MKTQERDAPVKVCAWCPESKKAQVGAEARITHGMCEECAKRILGEEGCDVDLD